MDIIIRKETELDYSKVRDVVRAAFSTVGERDEDFNEWTLVEKIRNSDYYLNELSLVAEIEDRIVGHIMFTPLTISGKSESYDSLDLAPVSVDPDFQGKGIGKQLVKAGIEKARELGYKSLIVMGSPKYYMNFGFELASKWKIGLDENCNSKYLFALELVEGGLDGISGIVHYCPPFYNENGELI